MLAWLERRHDEVSHQVRPDANPLPRAMPFRVRYDAFGDIRATLRECGSLPGRCRCFMGECFRKLQTHRTQLSRSCIAVCVHMWKYQRPLISPRTLMGCSGASIRCCAKITRPPKVRPRRRMIMRDKCQNRSIVTRAHVPQHRDYAHT